MFKGLRQKRDFHIQYRCIFPKIFADHGWLNLQHRTTDAENGLWHTIVWFLASIFPKYLFEIISLSSISLRRDFFFYCTQIYLPYDMPPTLTIQSWSTHRNWATRTLLLTELPTVMKTKNNLQRSKVTLLLCATEQGEMWSLSSHVPHFRLATQNPTLLVPTLPLLSYVCSKDRLVLSKSIFYSEVKERCNSSTTIDDPCLA